jgi:hypothetical protein
LGDPELPKEAGRQGIWLREGKERRMRGLSNKGELVVTVIVRVAKSWDP